MKRSEVLKIRELALKEYETTLNQHVDRGLLKKKQVEDILAGFDDGFWIAVNHMVGVKKD